MQKLDTICNIWIALKRQQLYLPLHFGYFRSCPSLATSDCWIKRLIPLSTALSKYTVRRDSVKLKKKTLLLSPWHTQTSVLLWWFIQLYICIFLHSVSYSANLVYWTSFGAVTAPGIYECKENNVAWIFKCWLDDSAHKMLLVHGNMNPV